MPNSKRFLLHPVGSAGDVYPFIGLGLALKARGHDVTVLTSGYFRETAERTGLDFVDTLSKEEFCALMENPLLWTKVRGAGTLLRSFTKNLLKRCYDEIVKRYDPGNTAILTPCIGFAGKLANEKLGIPLATVSLQPALLWSDYDGPVLDGILPWAPNWVKHLQYFLAETLLVDPNILPALNALREELGLKAIRRVTKWWASDHCILCLYPEWYAPRQPDWPASVRLSQFPIWTEDEGEALPDDVEDFLGSGEKPVVFTPGSANMHGKQFFEAAVAACEQIGARAMLFSKFMEHIPANLPAGIKYFKYAPFSKLLSRCAAISHHGGIGTLSNAMAAGIPQLIMPYTFDQPDNAARIKRLRLGDFLIRRKYRKNELAKMLVSLLQNDTIATSCKETAEQIRAADPFDEACQIAESIVGTDVN